MPINGSNPIGRIPMEPFAFINIVAAPDAKITGLRLSNASSGTYSDRKSVV